MESKISSYKQFAKVSELLLKESMKTTEKYKEEKDKKKKLEIRIV